MSLPLFSLGVSSKSEDRKKLVCLLKFLNGTVFLLSSKTLFDANYHDNKSKNRNFPVPSRKISQRSFAKIFFFFFSPPRQHVYHSSIFFRFDLLAFFVLLALIINRHAINVFNHSLGNFERNLSRTQVSIHWCTNFPRQSFESCSMIHHYF